MFTAQNLMIKFALKISVASYTIFIAKLIDFIELPNSGFLSWSMKLVKIVN